MPSPTLTRTVLQYPLAPFDPDTRDYIVRVERADGQQLETGVRQALDRFVRGCKSDGIWDAIKASCVMMGARTLAGALTPLKGAAPTNFNFVSGDYNRKTGLVGNGTTKYLDSNRNNNADPQNGQHLAAFATTSASGGWIGGGGASVGASAIMPSTVMRSRSRAATSDTSAVSLAAGFTGVTRSASANYTLRTAASNSTVTRTSQAPANASVLVFERGVGEYTASRISYYSIGESLDLALLDARVTALRNAIATSIDGVTDPDARAYINAVEAADGVTLEPAVAQAIGTFVVGCKADGIWDAIKASCIMMGAGTLAGALVPLKGAAPTNFNFVSGDYNRKTGLVGNGTTKYLHTNRLAAADPQDNNHAAAFVAAVPSSGITILSAGVTSTGATGLSLASTRSRNTTAVGYAATSTGGLVGMTRSSSTGYVNRANGTNTTVTQTSEATVAANYFVYARDATAAEGGPGPGKLQ